MKAFGIVFVALLFIVAGVSGNPASAGDVESRIRALSEQFEPSQPRVNETVSLSPGDLLPRIYELRDYSPAWFGGPFVDELLHELEAGLAHGFRPNDFHLPLLYELRDLAKTGGPEEIAEFDVAATDAAVRLIHHMVYGKVDPAALDADWNFDLPIIKSDPAEVITQYLSGKGFSALIERVMIDNPQYSGLLIALAQYREIELAGGWQIVPDGEVIKPEAIDTRVAALRARLEAEGVLTAGAPETPDLYDAALQDDVRRFQLRHGLEDDGVIGGKTFQALNRTVGDRVDQLRLSLERARWLMRDLEESFVLVNIAGARTYLVRGDDTTWETRSITGSQYRKTPVFRDTIRYMEFNPTWTVPSSIFRKDKLAKIRKDPGYLVRNNYKVRGKDGSYISPSVVNWGATNPAVTLVQSPGPNNALGLVKFMFPNKYSVYLHDTNDRSLFGRNERNLSSGCVRLEHPFEFANLLMESDPNWSQAKMQSILDSKKTTRVDLPQPVPVLLTYWTAWVEDGAVQFREDIYERDGRILAELNK